MNNMNLISSFLSKLDLAERQKEAMQDIIITMKYPLMGVKPSNAPDGWEQRYLLDDEWVVSKLEEAPEWIMRMQDENKIRFEAELVVNREQIKYQLESLSSEYKTLLEYTHRLEMQFRNCDKIIRELREENELLKSEKVKVVLLRDGK